MRKNVFKKSLVFGIIVLFIGASVVPMIGAFVVSDEFNYLFHSNNNLNKNTWWDFNWRYYKQLNISNPVINYQMLITVFNENGHDDLENGIIDCEGNCKLDFSDIRFIDQTNSIQLSYWIETIGIDNGDHYSRMWVKTTGDNAILMYYCNPNAISQSSGTSTFVFCDDFDSYAAGEPNPDGWSITTCSFETSCSVVCDISDPYYGKCLDVYGYDANSNSPYDQYTIASKTINLAYGTYELRVYMKASSQNANFYGFVRRDGTVLISKNGWNTWNLGTAIFTASVTNLELEILIYQLWNGDHNSVHYDNLIIRKYAPSEPYWANFSDQYNGNAPNPPTIDGPTSAKVKVAHQWIFTSKDPNNDDVFYQIDWGDGGVSIWYGPYDSDYTMNQSHGYEYKGIYYVRAKAKDTYGVESDYKIFEVKITMPRNYSLSILKSLGRFQSTLPILRYIIKQY